MLLTRWNKKILWITKWPQSKYTWNNLYFGTNSEKLDTSFQDWGGTLLNTLDDTKHIYNNVQRITSKYYLYIDAHINILIGHTIYIVLSRLHLHVN